MIGCDGVAANLSTSRVLTQSDGVHVTVHNTSGERVTVNRVGFGQAVPPGDTELVFDVRPQVLAFTCGYDGNRSLVPAGSVEVADLGSNWIPTNIDCTQLPLVSFDGPIDSAPTPEMAVRWWADNRPNDLRSPIAADDEIVLVGYREAAAPRYVSRRAGQDTNIFRLDELSDGWRATPDQNCPQ